MVPLRLDVCENRPRPVQARVQPQLVLTDISEDRIPRRSGKRNSLRRFESALLATALVAVLLFFVVNFAVSLFHTIQQSYAPSTIPSQVIITKTVMPGDTVTKLVNRYGDPSVYLPEREEQLLRLNPWLRTSPLIPGQRLLVPVTKHSVIAQLQKYNHHALLASR